MEINKEAPYSRKSLIWELEKYNISSDDTEFAADHSGIDYNKNADRKAKTLLEYDAYSKERLIGRLKDFYYIESEAIQAANRYDTDEFWIKQGVRFMKNEWPIMIKEGNESYIKERLTMHDFTEYQAE